MRPERTWKARAAPPGSAPPRWAPPQRFSDGWDQAWKNPRSGSVKRKKSATQAADVEQAECQPTDREDTSRERDTRRKVKLKGEVVEEQHQTNDRASIRIAG